MKTDMLFVILLFCSTLKLTVVVTAATNGYNCTPFANGLHKFNNHVLKRRIRSVVFPSKAQLLLTPAFTKAVLDGRPRGLLYSVEFDMYSPLPDTIEGWKPTILLNKHRDQDKSSQSLKTTTARTNISQNIKSENQPHFMDYDYYHFPFHEAQVLNVPNIERTNQPASFSNKEYEYTRNPYQKLNNLQGFAGYFHKQPHVKKTYKNVDTQNIRRTKRNELHLHQSDRERKQIYKQLEIIGKIFQFNMKSCIQRAICELSSNFRPYGESVMEDIVRLIVVPSYKAHSSGPTRYHVNNFRENDFKVNCKQRFAISCSYSILELLSNHIYNKRYK